MVRTRIGQNESHRRFALFAGWNDPLPEVITWLLVDTGAATTFLDQAIIDRLKLKRRSVTRVLPPGETVPRRVDTFIASLQLVGDNGSIHRVEAWEVCSWDFSERRHKGLLGRDMLRTGILHYKGRQQKFILEF